MLGVVTKLSLLHNNPTKINQLVLSHHQWQKVPQAQLIESFQRLVDQQTILIELIFSRCSKK